MAEENKRPTSDDSQRRTRVNKEASMPASGRAVVADPAVPNFTKSSNRLIKLLSMQQLE